MVKLLIVEDDLLLGEAYQRKYSSEYDVHISMNGASGLTMARSWLPDMILLDIYLPGEMDGLDVLRELKKDIKTASIPVVVVTNLPDSVEKVKMMGANECFMKTEVDLDQIGKILSSFSKKSI